MGGVLLAAAGAVAGLNWTTGSVLDDPERFRTCLVIVGVEFGVAAAGAAVLLLLRRSDHVAPWICLVVGVHFFPMAPVLDSPALYVLAARRSLPAGLATGAVLLCFALWPAVGLLL